ncbi:MAG: hypothetical protein O7F71_23580, partial [Gammaproteobacteria bacterium]|nr:hypothetical protein [Gammaproteobacteria bacterium]
MFKHILIALCVLFLTANSHSSQTESLRVATMEFLESLNADQRKVASFELKDDVRATWSNLP